ncbi:MAG: spore maturation protein [Oscillospiraceae bacterium]|nr:spore maturation protein [Oscillospiraceae bacterium]
MELIVPLTVGFILLFGMIKRTKIFDSFIEGAIEGMHTLYMIIPTITGLVVAVEMLQKSGAIDLVCKMAEPLADFFNFPKEIVPMAVLRPVSGSGATALLTNIFENYGPDSFPGEIASVLAGSSETTIYAVTMYFGSVGITKTRHTLWVGLLADLTALIMSIVTVKFVL